MSLKTKPKGLLAALVVLGIILLQMPAMFGGASAARVAIPRVAATAHHVGATRAGAIRPHTQTIGPSSSVTFVEPVPVTTTTPPLNYSLPIPGSSAAISPTAEPAGAPVMVFGNVGSTVTTTGTAGVTVTVLITDASGTRVISGTTVSGATGAFTFTSTLPVTTAFGAATATASFVDPFAFVPGTRAVATLPTLTVNQPAAAAAAPSGATLTSATRCTTATVTLTNFAPGVPVTPTLVFSSTSGTTTTQSFAPVSPLANGSTSEGNISETIQITNGLAYGTTGVVSVAASYPVTPAGGFPSFTAPTAPTISVSPGPTGPVGPFGQSYTTGMTNTLNISGTGGFAPNSPIAFTLGLSGTTGAAVTPSTPVTTDASGNFGTSTTIPFSTSVAGTYALTATDGTGCNLASTTFTVVTSTVPVAGPPVASTFFAEGYTGSGTTNGKSNFKTTYALLNPNVSTVVVTMTYLIEAPGTTSDVTPTTTAPNVVQVTHVLAPLADIYVDAATDIASAKVLSGPSVGTTLSPADEKFATIVQTAGYQSPVVSGLGAQVRGVAAERIIERTGNGGQRFDGDVSQGTTSANTSYYFAEGYTGAQFQEYLLLFNPSPTVSATVTVVRVPEGAATTEPPLIDGLVLAPYQRVTLNMRRLNALSPERSIGLIINSADNPIVAERVEYFGPGNGSAKPGESIAAGLTTAAKQLLFAYGSLTGISDTATTFVPSSDVAQTVDDRPFIEVINPNIAGQVVAGTVSGSAVAPGPAAHVTIQLRGENGRLLGFFFTDVDAGARFTLTFNDLTASSGGIPFPAVVTATDATGAPSAYRAGVFSAVVSSSERVVAEEAQYYGQGSVTPSGDANSGAPGLTLVGAPTGETDVLFPALNETDPASTLPLSQTVFLYNPGVNTIRVNGTFFGPTGVLAHGVYQIAPDHIQVIGNNVSTVGDTIAATGTTTAFGMPAATTAITIPAGTMGAEFSTIQQRGGFASGEPAQAEESFVAAAVTHSADATNWWGTQGLYPLPTTCSTPTGAPIPSGCP